MSVAPNHARLLALTARQSDLEYKLTMLMTQMQQLSNCQSALTQQRYEALEAYTLKATGSDKAPVIQAGNAEYVTQFDVQLAELESAQEKLDLQKAQYETQQKAVVTEKESVQKLEDSSIKEEFKGFN